MLDRPGDARPDVELRRDRLSGLANLRRVGVPAGVDHRAGRGNGAAKCRGEFLKLREALGCPKSAATGDEDVGFLDGRPGLGLLQALEVAGSCREVTHIGAHTLGRPRAGALSRLERTRTHEADPGCARPTDVDENGVAEGGTLPDECPAVHHEVAEIPVESGVEARGETPGDVGCEHRRPKEDIVEAMGLDQAGDHVNARLRQRSPE